MSFIRRELDAIAIAISDPANAAIADRLYAAQQALWWTLDPSHYRAPLATILGTAADTGDCPAASHREPSLETAYGLGPVPPLPIRPAS